MRSKFGPLSGPTHGNAIFPLQRDGLRKELETRHVNSQSEIRYSEQRSEATRIRFASRPIILDDSLFVAFRFMKQRIRYSEKTSLLFALTRHMISL